MNQSKKVVYLFCYDLSKDPVARYVFDASVERLPLEKTEITIDSYPVLTLTNVNGDRFYYVRTNEVVSHDYPYYLPILNEHFADFDFAGIVNCYNVMTVCDRKF